MFYYLLPMPLVYTCLIGYDSVDFLFVLKFVENFGYVVALFVYFFFQEVHFVEEKDESCVTETGVVDNGAENDGSLLQPVLSVVLAQPLVELRCGNHKQGASHVCQKKEELAPTNCIQCSMLLHYFCLYVFVLVSLFWKRFVEESFQLLEYSVIPIEWY